ncbi:MAG: hypothetical protein Q7S82_00375 [bacterium]|nr:hypothetical protein [bacterium]
MFAKQTDDELLKRAEKLQQEAMGIIDKLGIFSILKKISEPSIIGSAENGLMVWPDIDIHAYMKELDLDKVLDLLKEFALLPTIQKVQFSNFRELRRDHLKSKMRFPRGYYVGLRSVQPSGEWKVDIWFGEKGTPINDYDVLNLSSITKEQRAAILRIKKAWLDEKGGYKDGVISIDIYKAVLEHGIIDENNFKDYIKSNNESPH